ncbi:LLM class flavin-dependent oxidoreductase [Mycolicibacterium sp. XJ1819]
MRFGIVTEADTTPRASIAERYHEVLREVQYAEEMGFDFWGPSEQHFIPPVATISASEVLLGAASQVTSSIELRAMSFVMLPFNHPIRVAERVATLDILTKGRFTLGTARGNNANVAKAFEVDQSKTREQWQESLELCVKALTETDVEWKGDTYTVDKTTVYPRLYSPEMPPIFLSATSIATHEIAGQFGLGAMHAPLYGWSYLKDCVSAYKTALRDAKPMGNYRVNDSMSIVALGANCAATTQQAFDDCRISAHGFVKWLIEFYSSLSETSPDYAYFADIKDVIESEGDNLEGLNAALPWFLIGTPDEVIEQTMRYKEAGIDEMILRLDGFGHEKIMHAIKMFGKYVIPEFKTPAQVNRQNPYEDVGVKTQPWLL